MFSVEISGSARLLSAIFRQASLGSKIPDRHDLMTALMVIGRVQKDDLMDERGFSSWSIALSNKLHWLLNGNDVEVDWEEAAQWLEKMSQLYERPPSNSDSNLRRDSI